MIDDPHDDVLEGDSSSAEQPNSTADAAAPSLGEELADNVQPGEGDRQTKDDSKEQSLEQLESDVRTRLKALVARAKALQDSAQHLLERGRSLEQIRGT